jgi:hypothetical protein
MRTVLLVIVEAVFGTLLVVQLVAQAPPFHSLRPSVPDTGRLITRVAQHQKDVEALLTQYTFTDKTTIYTLDKAGSVRSQHTDTYYITPTPYEVFTLHISHDGKPTSQETFAGRKRRSSASYETTSARLKRIRLAPKTLFCSPTLFSSRNSIL